MRTRPTDLLEIEHPIMLAGTGGVSYHRLVAAVSEAGGIGTPGASTRSAAELPDDGRGPRAHRQTVRRRSADGAVASMNAGVDHLGAPDGTEVDVDLEFMPCGQGAGAIHDLVPAGELVRQMIDGAERSLARIASLR